MAHDTVGSCTFINIYTVPSTNCATTLGLWLVLWCPCSVTDLFGEVLFPLHVTGPLTQVHRFNTIYVYYLLHGNLRSCHLGGTCFWWLVSRLFQRISIKELLLPAAHVIWSFRTHTWVLWCPCVLSSQPVPQEAIRLRSKVISHLATWSVTLLSGDSLIYSIAQNFLVVKMRAEPNRNQETELH